MMAGSYSCEPGRRRAYNEDIRWRMIWQKEVMGLSVRKVAKNLSVAVSTVWRINNLFYCTGSVMKRSYPAGRRPEKKLTECMKLFILHTVVDSPWIHWFRHKPYVDT